MKIAIAFVLMLSGYWVDVWSMMTQPSIETWQNIYPVVMDLQIVGFSLFAFDVCPYHIPFVSDCSSYIRESIWYCYV